MNSRPRSDASASTMSMTSRQDALGVGLPAAHRAGGVFGGPPAHLPDDVAEFGIEVTQVATEPGDLAVGPVSSLDEVLQGRRVGHRRRLLQANQACRAAPDLRRGLLHSVQAPD